MTPPLHPQHRSFFVKAGHLGMSVESFEEGGREERNQEDLGIG